MLIWREDREPAQLRAFIPLDKRNGNYLFYFAALDLLTVKSPSLQSNNIIIVFLPLVDRQSGIFARKDG